MPQYFTDSVLRSSLRLRDINLIQHQLESTQESAKLYQDCAKFCSHSQKRFSKWQPYAIFKFVRSCTYRQVSPVSQICPHTKFDEDIWNRGRTIELWIFSKWRPPPSWISQKSFSPVYIILRHFNICVHPNFVWNILFRSRDIAKNGFKDGGRPPSWLLSEVIFYAKSTFSRTVSNQEQNLVKISQQRLNYYNEDFQYGGRAVRHLDAWT